MISIRDYLKQKANKQKNIHFLFHLKRHSLSLQAQPGDQHFYKRALKPESTVLREQETQIAVPCFVSLCIRCTRLIFPLHISYASSIWEQKCPCFCVKGAGSWREGKCIAAPLSSSTPSYSCKCRRGVVCAGLWHSCSETKQEKKKRFLMSLFIGHAFGASLSSWVSLLPREPDCISDGT